MNGEIRLAADDYNFWIAVRLYEHAGRWVAVADLAGERDLGLGLSQHDACCDALEALDESARRAFLRSLAAVD